MKIVLESAAYEVETISDWRLVFDKIREYKPDLVILDIFIADADGRVICKELKKSKTTTKIPVILFSASNRLEAYTKDSGAQGYLKKPFENAELINIIKENINHKMSSHN